MTTSIGKYKSIGSEERKEQVIEDYLSGEYNRSQLAKKYGLPYSTLRRFLMEEVKARNLEDQFLIQYFNVEDFPYLEVGDTFQFDAAFKTWKVIRISKKESDKVFELVPSEKRGKRHFICEEQVFE